MRARTCYLFIGLVAMNVGLAGCDRDEIRAYQAPKDPPSAAGPVASPPPKPAGRPAQMQWTAPDEWRRVPGDRPMRVATFETASAQHPVEIVVSAFPDQAGGLLPNVNRWRGQLGLEPIGEKDLSGHLTPFSNGQVHGFTLDMTGSSGGGDQEPARIVGAIIHDGVGMTWFVKAMDQPANLDPHKDAIIAFARSFRLAGPGHDQGNDRGHAHAHDRPQPDQDDHDTGIDWQKPSHWQHDPNTSSIVAAAFNIANPAGQARVTVTSLVGDGGGVLANINRWRHQMGLPLVERVQDQPVTRIGRESVGEPPSAVIDLVAPAAGTGGRQRMLVAMVPRGGQTWFIKLTGPDTVVEEERQAFERLVVAVRAEHTHP